jgi:hypothetical protein
MTSNVSCATTIFNHRGLPHLDIFTGSHSSGTQCSSNNSRIFQTPCIFRGPFIPPTHSFLSMTILVVLRAEEGITQTTDRTTSERHSSSPYSCNICSFSVFSWDHSAAASFPALIHSFVHYPYIHAYPQSPVLILHHASPRPSNPFPFHGRLSGHRHQRPTKHRRARRRRRSPPQWRMRQQIRTRLPRL